MTSQNLKDVFEAFSTLSDVQELISIGHNDLAIKMINHAKLHLNRIAEGDMEAYRKVMLSSCFEPCELEMATS